MDFVDLFFTSQPVVRSWGAGHCHVFSWQNLASNYQSISGLLISITKYAYVCMSVDLSVCMYVCMHACMYTVRTMVDMWGMVTITQCVAHFAVPLKNGLREILLMSNNPRYHMVEHDGAMVL